MDLLAHFNGARNVVSVPAGGVLFAEGDPATNMYILLEGQADICVGGDVVESALPPALLGEMALVDRSARSATVVSRLRAMNERLREAIGELSVRGRRPR